MNTCVFKISIYYSQVLQFREKLRPMGPLKIIQTSAQKPSLEHLKAGDSSALQDNLFQCLTTLVIFFPNMQWEFSVLHLVSVDTHPINVHLSHQGELRKKKTLISSSVFFVTAPCHNCQTQRRSLKLLTHFSRRKKKPN